MVQPPKKPAANNSAEGRARKRQRKAKILEMLLGGIPYTDIRRNCAIEFDVSFRTIEKYISEVRAEIPDCYGIGERKMMIAEAIGKAEKLYAKALVKHDLKTALNVLRWVGELQGINGTMQAARLHADAQSQLMALRVNQEERRTDSGDTRPRSLPLEAFNESLSVYGVPSWPDEKWLQLQQGNKKGN